MPTIHRPAGTYATLTRIATTGLAAAFSRPVSPKKARPLKHTNTALSRSLVPPRKADPFGKTNTPRYRQRTGLAGPACEYYPPANALMELPALESLQFVVSKGLKVPAPLLAMGRKWGPYCFDAAYCGRYFDTHGRMYTERMFDETEPGYLERFILSMVYVTSPAFDIERFDDILRLYEIARPEARLCVAAPAFEVVATDLTEPAEQQTPMGRYAQVGVYFERATEQLIIRADGKLSAHDFRTCVKKAEQAKFGEGLLGSVGPDGKSVRFAVPEETLVGLFEEVSERLQRLPTLHRVLHCSMHGPGWTEVYFPDHRYPDDFVERSKPRADEVPPVYSEVHTVSAGQELHFHTVYQDEAQIRDLYQGKLKKFLIPSLDTGRSADEQIALIAGFVSDLVTAHVFTDANNRVWIQILLNHLLRSCGQSDSILAVPNGFAAKVRYDLGAANHPAPGTEAYLDAMRLAIQTIQDGQRYYASLCAQSPCELVNIAPHCWL